MRQPFRTASGGAIDRERILTFKFDGRTYLGHPGDTLASALLANGIRMVGRSFKYHRPRGILSAGCEEPNGLVVLGEGARSEPNARATMIELYDGLVARPQNAWPSLRFDFGGINNVLSPFFPAGFYYKTFMGGPKGAWTKLYEPVIRRMAGLGPAPVEGDPDSYDKRHAHCEVLVVGAGAAGLAAANAAAAKGARVILVDEQPTPGGSLKGSAERIDGLSAQDWARAAASEFVGRDNGRLLVRTTAFGRYDHGMVMALEKLTDHDPALPGPRQRLWQIRTKRIILATGAHEQPLVFGNNDLPGIMLAQAGQVYARHFGVLAGRRVLVATTTDSGLEAAEALKAAGASIVEIVDGRENRAISRARGRAEVRGAEILSAGGRRERVSCDAILMSGGWQPAVHLHCHAGGRTRYDEALGCFVPASTLPGIVSAGGCAGTYDLSACIDEGHRAGSGEESRSRSENGTSIAPERHSQESAVFQAPFTAKGFVDFQNDVTSADIDLAVREGFVSVEHLKRYTTTGMATDQGKLSNLNAISRVAANLGVGHGVVGTTTFRPPYTPVTFGALAGIDIDDLMDPVRVTPMHGWHSREGAVFENVGQWKRPWYYPKPGETMEQAVRRECRAVRGAAGMFDASTLGKIDVYGPDAATFLNLVYTNTWSRLEIGRCRYGLMLGDDGMVMDDGVTTRIGVDRYLMTTTTGNAALVMNHLEDLLQTEWPHLKVYLTSVTDHWAVCVVTGLRARDVLSHCAEGVDLSPEAFPHLSMREGRIGGVLGRIYRISFTGELSYEVHVSALHGRQVWEQLFAAGARFGITPYGTEAMHVLRAEKGYIIIGQETDGTNTPDDLGLGWAVGKSKSDFIGKRSLMRSDAKRADRKQMVGLRPADGQTLLEEGAQLTAASSKDAASLRSIGFVTSSYWSEAAGGPIALALLECGRERNGQLVGAHFNDRIIPCRVCNSVFYDEAGGRLHA